MMLEIIYGRTEVGIKSEKWMMRDGDGVVRYARDILVRVNRDLLSSKYVSWPEGFKDEWIMISVLTQFAIQSICPDLD